MISFFTEHDITVLSWEGFYFDGHDELLSLLTCCDRHAQYCSCVCTCFIHLVLQTIKSASQIPSCQSTLNPYISIYFEIGTILKDA